MTASTSRHARTTLRDALKHDNPSDHVRSAARLSLRRARHPSMHPPLAASLCLPEVFAQVATEMARFIPDNMAPLAQIEAYKAIFREAALRASRAMEAQRRLRRRSWRRLRSVSSGRRIGEMGQEWPAEPGPTGI